MLNVCDKVNLLGVGVYFRCVVLNRTSQFAEKLNVPFLLSNYTPREKVEYFFQSRNYRKLTCLKCLVQE